MKIHLTRDSVSMGDDAQYPPHLKVLNYENPFSIKKVIKIAMDSYRLPEIVGGKATWVLFSKIPLCVYAQERSEPQWFMDGKLDLNSPKDFDHDGDHLFIHFSYFTQQDPRRVFELINKKSDYQLELNETKTGRVLRGNFQDDFHFGFNMYGNEVHCHVGLDPSDNIRRVNSIEDKELRKAEMKRLNSALEKAKQYFISSGYEVMTFPIEIENET